MKVEVVRDPTRDQVEVFMLRDVPHRQALTQAYDKVIEKVVLVWWDVQDNVRPPPFISLPTEDWAEFMAALLELPQKVETDATVRHLEDVQKIRDQLMGMLDQQLTREHNLRVRDE
jgi:hypothetical protein